MMVVVTVVVVVVLVRGEAAGKESEYRCLIGGVIQKVTVTCADCSCGGDDSGRHVQILP